MSSKSSRNIKDIDILSFKQDLSKSLQKNCKETNEESLSKAITEVLDHHAPLKTRERKERKSSPWFTDEIHHAKRKEESGEEMEKIQASS